MIYIFDESLNGLLTAVFEWFERKPGEVTLVPEKNYQPDAFSKALLITNDATKANRVWKGLQNKLDKDWMRKFYCAYLAENPATYNHLFKFACYIFCHTATAEKNYGNKHVLAVAQMAKKVEREKHRMEAFIRFKHTADDIYYCGIDPDFNVIPLILNHFKNRYASQKWIIYDLKRKYGIYYDLNQVEEIKMELNNGINDKKNAAALFSTKEDLYACLWKDYFKSTNIVPRKNTKLHVQYVPKRYWKYLTEKQLN